MNSISSLTGTSESVTDMKLEEMNGGQRNALAVYTEKKIFKSFEETFGYPIDILKMQFNSWYERLFYVYYDQNASYYTFCTRVFLVVNYAYETHHPDQDYFEFRQSFVTPKQKMYIHVIDGAVTITDSRIKSKIDHNTISTE